LLDENSDCLINFKEFSSVIGRLMSNNFSNQKINVPLEIFSTAYYCQFSQIISPWVTMSPALVITEHFSVFVAKTKYIDLILPQPSEKVNYLDVDDLMVNMKEENVLIFPHSST
jgi:hypothetical protein